LTFSASRSEVWWCNRWRWIVRTGPQARAGRTAPRNHDAGNGQGHITPETAAIFGATYNPPENLWLQVFFTDSEQSQAAGRTFLKRYLSRTENRDAPISDKVAPAQIAAITDWGTASGERFAYLKHIKQPTLVVSGSHDVIVYTVNSLYLVQNMPNAKLILYPDATTVRGISITRTSFARRTFSRGSCETDYRANIPVDGGSKL